MTKMEKIKNSFSFITNIEVSNSVGNKIAFLSIFLLLFFVLSSFSTVHFFYSENSKLTLASLFFAFIILSNFIYLNITRKVNNAITIFLFIITSFLLFSMLSSQRYDSFCSIGV